MPRRAKPLMVNSVGQKGRRCPHEVARLELGSRTMVTKRCMPWRSSVAHLRPQALMVTRLGVPQNSESCWKIRPNELVSKRTSQWVCF